MNKRVKSDIRR